MNAWAARHLAMLQKDVLDRGGEMGIFAAMLAGLAAVPGIITTL
jgi:hypothetical protein